MEYSLLKDSAKIKNKVNLLFSGVKLTGGRLYEVFENNIKFLKRFDFDRLMYWFRVKRGVYAPKAPYGYDGGHFENNLYGQTAAMYLMSAGTLLLWREDSEIRDMMNKIVDEIEESREEDGYLIPLDKEKFPTKEYPNYVRAWFTFGLLAAGYAGNEKAFRLVRDMGDWFNNQECLPIVKDLNLGFQGILANTALYLSKVGAEKDLEVAEKYYREDFWLKWLYEKDHTAIYNKPGNHPHGTLITTLEGYLDIYRATGEEYLLECIKNALSMYEDKWQHVGGGIVMCEGEPFYPGCNYLNPKHQYNELCCSTFWALLNQRMLLLEPDNEHYANEIEKTIYNVLAAAQVEDRGIHYLALLEGCKDKRFTDVATCCAATGSRMMAMLPQFIYTYKDNDVYVNLYENSEATVSGAKIIIDTSMPYHGRVKISVKEAAAPVNLHLRIPSWCSKEVIIMGKTGVPGTYLVLENINGGTEIEFTLPMSMSSTLYTGEDEIEGKDRYALEYGPLLLAAMGRGKVELSFNTENPDESFERISDTRFKLKNDNFHEYMTYMDIQDEPLTVYPVVL
ncbi:MAG: hypothetical protein E7564_10755 [Ruminococcaceae bacterium]|nr:hypothetical protein [Oscillospiraceae bacterium]